MTHEELRDRLLDLACGELAPREARAVEEHAAACEACRGELARMRETRRLMSALPQEPAPAGGERILLAAAREAVRGRRPRRALPQWLWGAAVAASLAVVAGVSYRLLATGPRPLDREDPDALMGEQRFAKAPSEPPAAATDRETAPPSSAGEPRGAEPLGKAAPAEAPPPSAGGASPDERSERDLDSLSPTGGEGRGEGARPFRREATAPPAGRKSKAAPPERAREAAGAPSAEPTPEPQRFAAAPPPPAPESSRAPGPAPAEPPSVAEAPSEEPEAHARAEGARAAGDAATAAAPAPRAAAEGAPSAAPPPRAAAAQRAAPRAAAPADAPAREEAPGEAAASAPSPAAEERYDALRRAGRLRGEIQTFPGCEGEAWRKVELAPGGMVVKYVRQGWIGGRRLRIEHLYAADGTLASVSAQDLGRGGPPLDPRALGIAVPERAEEAGPDAPPRCGR